MRTRRRFLQFSAAVGGALATLGLVGVGAAARAEDRATQRDGPALRVLVLGGTGFIGPHLVHVLVQRGHRVSVFNRGRSRPRFHADAFDAVEALVGDRDDDLDALHGREWDAVIDNSGYTPEQVRASARLLVDAAGQYVFTSTRAVYADFRHSPMDEDAPVGMHDVPAEQWRGYGPLKALAERDVTDAFGERASIVRPPIVTGPGDHTDRFTFWYHRVQRGGEVLAPGAPDDPIQYIDVRDLVEFMVRQVEHGITGTYNVTAPAAPLSTAGFLHGLRATTGEPVRFTWVDWDFLAERGLRGGAEIAAWRAPRGDDLNYGRIDSSRAIEAGLRFRPLADTATDALDWWRAHVEADGGELRSGYSAQREAEVLAAWHGR